MLPSFKFAEVLEPETTDRFFSSVWGKTMLHVQGEKGRFARLLPWASLNRILSQHRIESPRLRLALDGKMIPEDSYIQNVRNRIGREIPILSGARLTEKLREGATLILDDIDEMYYPIRTLADDMEKVFHERIHANAYAGWYKTHGFDLHWDDHGVFVLQVSGRKHWGIYGVARPHPLRHDSQKNDVPPAAPIWEGILNDGDLLYLPRGWWHVATPLSEPSLHLTFGVNSRTGIDFLEWLCHQMRAIEAFRMDLPRFASVEDRASHMKVLKAKLLEYWDDDILSRYFNDYDAQRLPRTNLSLPWSVTPDVLPPSDETTVKWLVAHEITIGENGNTGSITFGAHGMTWQLPGSAKPVLRLLVDRDAYTVNQLCNSLDHECDRVTLRLILSQLVLAGLLTIVETENKQGVGS
jgi:cupin superfamily protein